MKLMIKSEENNLWSKKVINIKSYESTIHANTKRRTGFLPRLNTHTHEQPIYICMI